MRTPIPCQGPRAVHESAFRLSPPSGPSRVDAQGAPISAALSRVASGRGVGQRPRMTSVGSRLPMAGARPCAMHRAPVARGVRAALRAERGACVRAGHRSWVCSCSNESLSWGGGACALARSSGSLCAVVCAWPRPLSPVGSGRRCGRGRSERVRVELTPRVCVDLRADGERIAQPRTFLLRPGPWARLAAQLDEARADAEAYIRPAASLARSRWWNCSRPYLERNDLVPKGLGRPQGPYASVRWSNARSRRRTTLGTKGGDAAGVCS
jgi:hypothetical protein